MVLTNAITKYGKEYGMKRKGLFLLLYVSFLSFVFWVAVWTSKAESKAHFTPGYAKEDIAAVLQKEELAEEDYALLFRQTGMSKAGVNELLRQGEMERLLYLQERFFEEVEVECLRSNIFVQYERIVEKAETVETETETVETVGGVRTIGSGSALRDFLPILQNGDILLSFSGHIFGWRYGHAAIVVDAERGLTVEAVDLGSKSKVRAIEHWAEYPGFVLLRVTGATREQKEMAARYAMEKLVGLPYSVFTFGNEEELAATHCAHLVWCAYESCGCDLDGNGGIIVTPADLLGSDLVEVVQIYGMEPE